MFCPNVHEMNSELVHGNDVIARDEPPLCVQRYLAGESLDAIAEENPRTYREFYRWMLATTKAEHADLVTNSLIDRVADADRAIALASNKLDASRAQTQAKFARMDLERKRPKLYGSQLNVQADTQITVRIAPVPRDITPTYRDVSLQHLLGDTESEST